MKKSAIQFLFLAFLLSACGPKVSSSVNPVQTPPTPDPTENSAPSFLFPVERIIIQSANYTIIVEHPDRAVFDLQQAVEKAGGYVVSASSWSGEDSTAYSSLSARIAPESLPALREAVIKIADQVQSQSIYMQDITSEYHELQQRHEDLVRAQDQTWQFMAQTNDHRLDSTFRILRELLDNDLENVEYQLKSYEQQARLATFDVTINQPAPVTVIIE